METNSTHDVDPLARAVQIVLLTGLIPSGILLALGLIVALASGQPRPDTPPAGFGVLIRTAPHGESVSMLELGVLLLMLTPLLRVIVLAVGWASQRNWRFAPVAVVVLSLLAISLAIGVG